MFFCQQNLSICIQLDLIIISSMLSVGADVIDKLIIIRNINIHTALLTLNKQTSYILTDKADMYVFRYRSSYSMNSSNNVYVYLD